MSGLSLLPETKTPNPRKHTGSAGKASRRVVGSRIYLESSATVWVFTKSKATVSVLAFLM